MRSIEVKLRNTFGTTRLIPACDLSKLFTELTGTQTLTLEHAKVIQSMGIKIKVSHADLGCETVERKINRGNL